MFLGYTANHTGNVYRMLNLETKKVPITRDIKWLKPLHAKPMRHDVGLDDDNEELQVLPVQPNPEDEGKEHDLDKDIEEDHDNNPKENKE